jgi:hypothetical protein
MPRDSRVEFRVPGAEHDWWKVCAQDLGVSVSGLARYCISNALAAHYEPPPQVDVPRLTKKPAKDPARMARVDPGIDALDMEVQP